MRAACIDIGSNTTRLLVAEEDSSMPGGLREVIAHRVFVRLTARERAEGLSAPKADAIAAAVAEQAELARAHGVAGLRVVATAALRDAPGSEALASRLSAEARCAVEILSGEQEARLAFAGATAGLARDGEPVAVVDVGGGSTELAGGVPGRGVDWWASVPLGSGALAEAHLHGDPPRPDELRAARAAAQAAIGGAGCRPVTRAWAVGGSATSLRRLVGPLLTAAAMDTALTRLCARPAAESARELGLDVERVHLLPAGLLLLTAAAEAVGCPLRVGGGGLREGVVLDLLARVR